MHFLIRTGIPALSLSNPRVNRRLSLSGGPTFRLKSWSPTLNTMKILLIVLATSAILPIAILRVSSLENSNNQL